MANKNLHAAKTAKNDEFYTQLSDIEKERIMNELGEDICCGLKKTIKSGADWVRMLIEDIEKAEKAGYPLVALIGALTLPDLCSKVEPFGESIKGKKRYKKWVHDYVYPIATGESEYSEKRTKYYENLIYTQDYLYQLRCFMIHEGVPNLKEEEVVKTEAKEDQGVSGFKFNLVLDDNEFYAGSSGWSGPSEKEKCIEIDESAREICTNICIAAKKYLDENEEKFDNMTSFRVIDNRKAPQGN